MKETISTAIKRRYAASDQVLNIFMHLSLTLMFYQSRIHDFADINVRLKHSVVLVQLHPIVALLVEVHPKLFVVFTTKL